MINLLHLETHNKTDIKIKRLKQRIPLIALNVFDKITISNY
jgi:hypothetical protein